MSDLFSIGSSAITAYRAALSTVGENVANTETPGYTRREIRLRESPVVGAVDPYGTGVARNGGTIVGSVERIWDDYRANDTRLASADAARAATRGQWLTSAEAGLDDGSAGIGAKLTSFFNNATKLAAEPNGTLPRRQALNSLDDIAGQIRASDSALSRVSDGIAAEATSMAQSINDDLAAMANVNLALNRSVVGSPSAAALSDERDKLLDTLSNKIGIDAKFDAKGVATITLAGSSGTTLMSGGDINLISIARATNGRIGISMTGTTATTIVPTGGAIAGMVDAAALVSNSRTTLDGIAKDFVDGVNAWNAGGKTPAGTTGTALMSGTNAASIAIVPNLATTAIAAAGATDGTLNGNIANLSTLRGDNGVEARVEALVGGNAQLLSSTKAEADAAESRRNLAYKARDDVSAVNLDKEAADLMRYQQAYDGSARVLQVAKETIQTILQLF
jgi:flagellar hook-associated protein 1 FlgK